MEAWLAELEAGRREAAWDTFLDRYRRLLFATIRHFVEDYDDVMDVFAHVCEALREDDFRRLRSYGRQEDRRARFSTWLVVVVRNLAVDWMRHRHGRPRPPAVAAGLPPLQSLIFGHVFGAGRSHLESYEMIRSRDHPDLTFGQYLKELAAVYRAVGASSDSLLGTLSAPPPPDAGGTPADVAQLADARRILESALAALPAQDRAAVELYVLDELPAADVARILGLRNAKAVYNRVYRALAALREGLSRAGLGRDDL